MIINTPKLSVGDAVEAAVLVMKQGYSAYLHGPSGIGKTYSILEYAAVHGMQCTTVYLADKNAGEAGGLPTLQNGVTLWTLPDYIANIGSEPHILFFDELSAAAPDVQIVAYQVLQERQMRGHKLGDNVWVCGAGNRPEDGAIAFEMGTALADRLCHFNVEPNAANWLEWAMTHNIHPDVMAFIKAKPKYLDQEYIDSDYGSGAPVDEENLVVPTPRSWERVSNMLYQTEGDESSYRIALSRIIPGWLGLLTAYGFQTFIRRMESLYSIEEYLSATPEDLVQMVPAETDALYGLIYNLLFSGSNPGELLDCFRVVKTLCSVPGSFRKEMLQVAVQIFAARSLQQGWSQDLVKHPHWSMAAPLVAESSNRRLKAQAS